MAWAVLQAVVWGCCILAFCPAIPCAAPRRPQPPHLTLFSPPSPPHPQIDPMAFRLPIPSALVPPTGGRPTPYPPSASKLQPVGGVVVGQGGHLSVTSLPDVDDIGPLVYANLWGLRRMGVADLPAQGLDTLASYAPNIGRQVRA